MAMQMLFLALGKFIGIKVCVVIGGRNVTESIQELKQGPHVVVGTPGQVWDRVCRGALGMQELLVLVLDEVCCTV